MENFNLAIRDRRQLQSFQEESLEQLIANEK
jgi:hypothetical protein